jgi:hypothetical protein
MGATISYYWYGTESTTTENSPLAITNNADAIKNDSGTVTESSNGTSNSVDSSHLVTGTTH